MIGIMEDPVKNFGEQEVNEVIENTDNQIDEHDDGLGADVGEKRWPGWPGESVFRILVPAQKVGGLIGRKGESIKRLCEESKARIKILDGPQGVPERAVSV